MTISFILSWVWIFNFFHIYDVLYVLTLQDLVTKGIVNAKKVGEVGGRS